MVVTIEVPTLLPIFRVKFTSPATALLLSSNPDVSSGGSGTKINPIGKYRAMPQPCGRRKLTNKSLFCVERYMPMASVIQPKAIRYRDWYVRSNVPRLVTSTKSSTAATERTMPAASAVYPINVWRNCDIKTVVAKETPPTMNIIMLAAGKFGILEKAYINDRIFMKPLIETKAVRHKAANHGQTIIKPEPNQSSSCPLSSMICNAATPSATREIRCNRV